MVERFIYNAMTVGTLGFIGYIISLIFGFKENARMVKFISCLSLVVITLQIVSPAAKATTEFFGKVDSSISRLDKLFIANTGGWMPPVSGGTVTQRFNGVDHHGMDIAVNEGTPVYASHDGKVSRAEWSNLYGQLIMIDYDNGLQVLYGHNRDILLSKGLPVVKGTKIAIQYP
jgi:murein DD-endopeptidase MepM/ murein hydrolase activator NlpD